MSLTPASRHRENAVMELRVLPPDVDLRAKAPGRPLRVVLLAFYNYQSHALRIFHPLLRHRGHDVHSIFFKNYFTYHEPTPKDCALVLDLVERLEPDLVGMSVWSTYYQLAARLTREIKRRTGAVVIWGGIHPQTKPRQCLEHADLVCKAEGELVLAELTDRMSLGLDWTDLPGTWVRTGDEIRENPSRAFLSDLDLLPPADLTPENKYYLGYESWRDVASWDLQAVSYDIMTARGCPFECTFCIHNFTRTAFSDLGTYLRRRSVEHVLAELRAAKEARPRLRTIAISDDIFAPPRPWLEEFCTRYKREIGLPFIVYSFPGMVDEKKVRLMREAGLWCTTIGIQSGSERIRRDCYERETSNETILRACRIFARYGVQRNLDFIGDNPYETDADRLETLDLLLRLPKPFYFNFFSLTYFPGVSLTERALRDGHITEADVEDVAQKGYHLWGGALLHHRKPEDLYWDVLYAMAVHGFPPFLVHFLRKRRFFRKHIRLFARVLRRVQKLARWKGRVVDALAGRPNLLWQYWADTNRKDTPTDVVVQPNFDSSPLSVPLERPAGGRVPAVSG
ncbi:MAG: hypothetical protein KatS3mg076_0539 [Candidatus Binatia bacterium]|nr:MAG: hypothetical protein KatS3mg076_0539 [Candidatus Binatia bacterium]